MNLAFHIPLQIFSYIAVLLLLCYGIGIIFSKIIASEGLWSRILIGYSILIIASSFSVRYEIPIKYILVVTILWAVVLLLALNFLAKKKELQNQYRSPLMGKSSDFLLIFISILIFFLPELISGVLVIQNIGPDLDGHMLSGSYINSGNLRSDVISTFSGELKQWNSLVNAWNYPDFLPPVALEFLLRSSRVGHAALISFLNVGGVGDIPVIFLSMLCFASICTVGIIYENLKNNGKFLAFCLASVFIFSQTLLISKVEGISAQLLSLPLITYVLINFWKADYRNISSGILIGILLVAISEVFSEGLYTVGFICFIFYLIKILLALIKRDRKKIIGLFEFCSTIILVFIFSDLLNFVDLFKVTLSRISQGFNGGALHLKWDFFSILFNFPHVRVPSTGVMTIETYPLAVAIFGSLVLICSKFEKLTSDKVFFLISILLACLLPILLGHSYASWKVCALISPFFLYLTGYLSPRFVHARFTSINLLAVGMLITSIYGYAFLAYDYVHNGRKIHPPKMIHSQPLGEYAFVTLQTDPFVFYKYGLHSPLFWLNSGYTPNFQAFGKDKLPVYGLIDCASLKELCTNKMVGNSYYVPLDKKVSDYLDLEGKIILIKAQKDFRDKLKKND